MTEFLDQEAKETSDRTKPLYAVPSFLQIPTGKNLQARQTWYAETMKLSPKSEDGSTPIKTQRYSSVIEELNYKLNSNIIDDFSKVIENESTYNNQSIRSFGSSKTDASSVVMDPALEFLQDEPLYQFYDAALLEVSFSKHLELFSYETNSSDPNTLTSAVKHCVGYLKTKKKCIPGLLNKFSQ